MDTAALAELKGETKKPWGFPREALAKREKPGPEDRAGRRVGGKLERRQNVKGGWKFREDQTSHRVTCCERPSQTRADSLSAVDRQEDGWRLWESCFHGVVVTELERWGFRSREVLWAELCPQIHMLKS